MEGGKYSTPAHSSYPVPHRRRETTEKHLWSSHARGIGSLKYEDLIIGLQNTSLPSHLSITLLKAYFSQFLLSSTSCPATKKKLQGILKGKNKTKQKNPHNLKGQSKIWQEYWNYQTGNLKQ